MCGFTASVSIDPMVVVVVVVLVAVVVKVLLDVTKYSNVLVDVVYSVVVVGKGNELVTVS